MNNPDLKIELDKLKQKLEKMKLKEKESFLQRDMNMNKSLYYLGRMSLSILFNNSEDLPAIIEESNKALEKERKFFKNKEKGYHYWYNDDLEPFSKKFGCSHCGGYCYTPYKSSNCQMEGCESEGKLLVSCPKVKCNGLICESQTLPLGCWFEQKSYTTDDHLDIHYNNKIYTFRVKKCLFGLISLIRRFFDYDLTRSEINEWAILERISNE